MATRILSGSDDWTLRPLRQAVGRSRRRGRETAIDPPAMPPQFLQSSAVSVEDVFAAEPRPSSRRGAVPELALEVDLARGEASLVGVRHVSGALTFHESVERVARSGRRGTGAGVAQFRIPIRQAVSTEGRRGVASKAVKVVVMKVGKTAVDKAVSVALPELAALVEKRIWTKSKIEEGWFQVTPAGRSSPALRLTAGVPDPGQRSLLLLHGTFSHAASAFANLAGGTFFERVRPLYGERIYAYNHFSVSRTPDDNAERLLRGLPPGAHSFDVITHSRGGLVLRSLVEHRRVHGVLADRFRLGRRSRPRPGGTRRSGGWPICSSSFPTIH
jgi:hypothetical protein